MVVLALLLLVAAVGTAREYTDEDLAKFPKLFHLDDYDRCLARRDGLYCLGTFDLAPAKPVHPTYELLKAYSKESYRHFNRTRVHRGYCVNTRCPIDFNDDDASLRFGSNASHYIERRASLHFERPASQRFERCVDRYTQARDLRASLRTLHYCRTHSDTIADTFTPTIAELILKNVIYTVILFNIIGTIYDVSTGDCPKKKKLLSAFSIPANWRRLTVIHEGGDPRLTALIPVQGFRFIALSCTLYAHASIMPYMFHTRNPEFLEQMTQRADGAYWSDGTSLIQAFIMLSCFLTGYNLLIFSQSRELGLHMLPLCIIKRVIRITPVHLLMVGFGATWWMNSRAGPLISTTIGLESEACKTKFWSHVFFLNNIMDRKEYCITPSWFLPVDMHMYILACTFTLILWRHHGAAIKLYIFLFIASLLATGVIIYINGYKSMIYLSTPELIRRLFRDSPSFTEFYISSWGAVPSCFIGLILAHIQFELDERKMKLSQYKSMSIKHGNDKLNEWFVYLHYSIFPITFIWALNGLWARNCNSPLFYAAYTTLNRPIFCILIAIDLLGLIHVHGPLRSFFSWRGWHAMARMSLTVMLLHWCINMIIAARPVAYGISSLDITVDWIATNFFSYIIAVPVTILVEFPMQKILGTIFSLK